MTVLVISLFWDCFKGFKDISRIYVTDRNPASNQPIEEFTNFITLSIQLYGNIFASEVLVYSLGSFAFSGGASALVLFPGSWERSL